MDVYGIQYISNFWDTGDSCGRMAIRPSSFSYGIPYGMDQKPAKTLVFDHGMTFCVCLKKGIAFLIGKKYEKVKDLQLIWVQLQLIWVWFFEYPLGF